MNKKTINSDVLVDGKLRLGPASKLPSMVRRSRNATHLRSSPIQRRTKNKQEPRVWRTALLHVLRSV